MRNLKLLLVPLISLAAAAPALAQGRSPDREPENRQTAEEKSMGAPSPTSPAPNDASTGGAANPSGSMAPAPSPAPTGSAAPVPEPGDSNYK